VGVGSDVEAFSEAIGGTVTLVAQITASLASDCFTMYSNGAEVYHVSWDIRLTWTADHFTRYAPEHIEYGVNRYQNETRRLYSVLDKHLASDNRPYLCGEKCTIAGKHSP